jgi:hypothetical protein
MGTRNRHTHNREVISAIGMAESRNTLLVGTEKRIFPGAERIFREESKWAIEMLVSNLPPNP